MMARKSAFPADFSRVGTGVSRGALFAICMSFGLGFAYALLGVGWFPYGFLLPVVAGGVVVVVREPRWIFLAFVFSLAIPIQRSIAGIPVNAADAILVVWCVLWPLAYTFGLGERPARLSLPPVVLCIVPFVVAVLMSHAGSINGSVSFKQALRIIEWFVVLPLALTLFLSDTRFQRYAAVAVMVIPCLFAIDGIYEYVSRGTRLTGMLGINVPIPEGGDNQIRHTFDVSGRAGSTFGGAQGLAMFLVMTMSVSVAHLTVKCAPVLRRLAWICLAISIGGLGVAQSRGGMVGALMVVLSIMMLHRRNVRTVLLVGTFVMLSIGIIVLGEWPGWDGTVAGMIPGRPEAVLDRLIIWGVVANVALSHPFLGVGLGNFRDAFFAHEPWLNVELAYPSLHAHNTYLELLADTGLIGLGCYLYFLFMMARLLIGRYRSNPDSVMTLAAFGALAAYAVFAMVDMLLLQNMHFLLVLMLSLGLSVAAVPRAAGESSTAIKERAE